MSARWCLLLVTFLMAAPISLAAEPAALKEEISDVAEPPDSADLVSYPASFFERYRPNTALDMIGQLPGFQLDDGDASRGFAASAGNLLVNDRRPSVKQDLPSEILARIPASQVRRIELIRGQVRDIDLQGQVVLANVVLRDIADAAVQWTGSLRYNIDYGFTFDGGISVSDRWRAVDYNAGVDLRHYIRGDYTTERILDGDGDLVERRIENGDFDGIRGGINLNAGTDVGATRVRLNMQVGGEWRDGIRVSDRTPEDPGVPPRQESYPVELDKLEIEIGMDAERNLRDGLLAKGILLYTGTDVSDDSRQISLDSSGTQTRDRISETDTDITEAIARFEMSWTGWPGHTVQANIERAYNSLDNALVQTVDTGDGPVFEDVPGANSRVQETRWDFLLRDTWSFGKFEFEYGLGAEVSTITQTGDAELERDFTYLKPQLAFAYSPEPSSRTRVGLARSVAQLDFSDFVSSTVFEDNDLALGNPDLQPETTWRLDLSHEQRFGKDTVVKLVLFHDWISDVQDLLPLSPDFEAPGNIGDGERWGVELESTVPLDRFGLKAARLDISARWQDSRVEDPVTEQDRVLSDTSPGGALLPLNYRAENRYAMIVDFRQDFQASRFAWGWDVRSRAERPTFKVNELDIKDEGTEFNVFIETTRWLNAKIKLAAENIFDLPETRDRSQYVGERDLSPVDFREISSRYRAFRVTLVVSGSF
jgi:hypothetical protein